MQCSPVASAPTNLLLEVQRDGTSVLLTWTPPDPLGDTTGYTISYIGGGGSGSETFSGGDTNNYTLTGLVRGGMYDISIVGTSEHFYSESVELETVTLVPGEHLYKIFNLLPNGMSLIGQTAGERKNENIDG